MSNCDSNWQIVSASVRGRSHEKSDLPCQDAYCYKRLSDDILIVAVADGAGSARLSEIGSRVAVQTAVNTLAQTIIHPSSELEEIDWKERLTDTLSAAKMAIEVEAAVQEVEIRELATTLILTLATSDFVAVAQVGDGAAVVEDKQGKIEAITQPEQGEYLNETKFLIGLDAVETAQINVWQGEPAHLAVFSDGLQMLALKMPEGTPHKPFFSPLFQFISTVTDQTEAQEQLESFLRSPRVTQRTDDDLTLILASL
ncbi:MAG: PP2C family serine/threonine-protein phosphatase [Limnoraphis robusta]|uniref:Serine/threonine protein phosphatase n=1 Tax=Limnoraphis robusta CS-951 TaxID=1637645 RepID=A0A0F5YBD2_9CYAN|nr:PP2C family serine/threonine-protein phosphatase [Limnoraphis robusta]KKD35530.1 serine/threonine protein phosphatase [Limnoraphis robusta CS-951]KMW69863.1 serine/threonine protein phosphatase [Limnoraphis robusta CS-951]MEA5539968.1 PP2C family serine/threonine-protein phosphatase [Limnoraphis robusta Tam1]